MNFNQFFLSYLSDFSNLDYSILCKNSIFCYAVYCIPHIRGALQDNFPGFLGFGFHRKLASAKTQQYTDKLSERNVRTVF